MPSYAGATQKGYPVTDRLYNQFQQANIDAQTNGQDGYRNYDHWYETNVMPSVSQIQDQNKKYF